MKTVIKTLWLILLPIRLIFSQIEPQILDSLDIPDTFEDPAYKVTSLELTGDFHELVISVGFPDVPSSFDFPIITHDNSGYFPKLGTFPDGTLLEDYVISQGGSIPMDEWLKPALDNFYDIVSGGVYTVDFDFLKNGSTHRYFTIHPFSYFANLNGGTNNTIWNYKYQICSEVVTNIWLADPTIFENIDVLHFTFEGFGNEFHTVYGGTIQQNVTFTDPYGQVIYGPKPVSYQRSAGAIIHERLHAIGAISGYPSGFAGLPDRGWDVNLPGGHDNLLSPYDQMYHNGLAITQSALYGYGPILSSDLIFFGWITSQEVVEINQSNYDDVPVQLKDVAYPIPTEQIPDGFHRVGKIMIHENYSGDLDEYFLIDYHKGSEFDRALSNYDEYQNYGANEGILIWHVKERFNMINLYQDNLIDLEAAVPYNGWYNNPVPPDPYPRDYLRPSDWNGNLALDFDYLDDFRCTWNSQIQYYQFVYMPDGGTAIWNYTIPPEYFTWNGGHYPWDPSGEDWPIHHTSLRSTFFTDESINGTVTNNLTDVTRPSAKDWAGNKTHIAIKNIRHVDDYMMVDVYYNYWEGELTQNETISGNATIGGDLIVPEGKTLTIVQGANINFIDEGAIIVNGTLNASNCQMHGTETWGLITFDGAAASNSVLDNVEITNGSGIHCLNGADVTISNCVLDNCSEGIYFYNSQPSIVRNQILDPENAGITGDASGLSVEILDNIITKSPSNPHYRYNWGINLTNSTNGYIAHNDISGFGYGMYIGGGSDAYFTDLQYSPYNPNNRSTDNYQGITAGWGGYIFAGSIFIPYGSNNSIFSNPTYDVNSYQSSYITAQHNWWGRSGPRTFVDGTSYLSVSYPLSSDPWNAELSISGDNKISKKLLEEPMAGMSDSEDVVIGSLLEMEGKIFEAVFHYKGMINRYSNPGFALSRLAGIKSRHPGFNIREYLESLLTGNQSYKPKVLTLLAGMLLQEEKYNQSMLLYNTIINEYPNSYISVNALFEKFFAVLNYAKNRELASQLLTELQSLGLNDSEYLMKLEIAEQLFNGNGMQNFTKQSNNIQINSSLNVPDEYSLHQNYPNPFNPSTTIKYDIPESGNVTLTIYDLLGREIAKLVDSNQQPGSYKVNFDASKLVSGVYIYRLQVNDFVASKKMILLK